MDNPKTIYSQSEARRLRAQPCPDCGKMSQPRITRLPEFVDRVDPEVTVLWHCPDYLCTGHDGFPVESQ